MTRPADELPLDPTLPQSPLPHSGDAANGASRFAPGRMVAERYRIVRWIAEGGMGEVYEAEDEHLHERVALKAVRARASADAQVIARFKLEIQLARKVTHPNACRIFDLGVDREAGVDVLFLTMELVRGSTLADRLHLGGPLALADAFEILAQVAAALDAAHAAGVIHRDLKTTNILLAPAGEGHTRAVVTDFGLARSLDAAGVVAERVTGAVQLVGTPAYMAPEQVEGQELSARTDVYQFGVVMYEVLTGRLPFEGHTPLSTAVKRVKEKAPSPRLHRPALTPAWEAAVLKCLELEPAARFASASDALRSLEQADLAEGTPAPEPVQGATNAATSRLSQPPARPRRSGGLAVAAVAACVSAVVVFGLLRHATRERGAPGMSAAGGLAPLPVPPAGTRRSLAVLPFANRGGDAEVAWVSLALGETLATELAAAEELRLVPADAVERTTADLELAPAAHHDAATLARLGKNLHVDYVLAGSYEARGAHDLHLALALESTRDGRTVFALDATGTSDDLPALVAAAAPRLYARLGVPPPDASARAATHAAQPASAAAARAYAEGTYFQNRLECARARALLEAAVRADPRHALAHAELAEAESCLGDEAGALASARRAWELSTGLRREQRLRIEAALRTMEHDHARVITIYRTLWEFFPDNPDYGLELGRAQAGDGQLREAEATIARLRQAGGGDDPAVDLLCTGVEYELANYAADLACAEHAIETTRARGARLLYGMARRDQAWALRFLGRTDEALAAALESRRVFSAAGNQALELQVLNTMGGVYLDQGKLRAALDARSQALALARNLGHARWIARLASNSAELARSFGDPLAARTLAQEGLDLALRIDEKSVAGYAYIFVGDALLDAGRANEARPYFRDGLALATIVGRKQAMVSAEVGLAWCASVAGDFAAAHAALDHAFALHAEMKTPPVEPGLELAHVLFREGRTADAERQLATTLAAADRQRDLFAADGLALRADLLLARGDAEGARREAALAVAAGTRVDAIGLALPGRMVAAHAAADEAALAAVIAEAERAGYLGLALDGELRLARLERAHGKRAAARARFDTIVKRARPLGQEWIARVAEAART
jgi:TolB-like protein/tRNA A-37 threonylcarbamoyl transferase component Bud32/uncharacterized protein YdbL (DUF1318 family)